MNSKDERPTKFRRSTSTRDTIMKAIIDWPGHFSAEELSGSLPSVSRASVFRTLAALQESTLICRVLVDGGTTRYRFGGGQHHHHLVCLECGEIQDIPDCDADEFSRRIASRHGYTIASHQLELYGYCSNCKTLD
ncbi:MAG: transcriptional repressor [SAR202 cluster bacterium]|nr:transcriptional repressor [SAR202 cluster bacterium]